MEKKTYILSAGKHHMDGKTFKKGDSIELTEEQAKGLTNKIVRPEDFGLTSSPDTSSLESENSNLKNRIAELELEVEQLKEAIGEDDD